MAQFSRPGSAAGFPGSLLALMLLSATCIFPQAGSLQLETSDARLKAAFDWAREQALHYASHNGDPVGPWYEAALPGREAFCMRDVAHQAMGAHALGLQAQNRNMLHKFAENISESKDWCSYWEINRHNRPAPVDYNNDDDFWYNLPANFDVLDACYRMYLWSGDRSYLDDPAFVNFYRRTVHDYVARWDLQPDRIMKRQRIMNQSGDGSNRKFARTRGIPGYEEGRKDFVCGADLIAAQIAAYTSYAHMQSLKGNGTEANRFVELVGRTRSLLNREWWDESNRDFYTYLTLDGKLAPGRGSASVLYFGAAGEDRIGPALEGVLRRAAGKSGNIEGQSHLPEILYRYGKPDAAYAQILDLIRPGKPRREYPEVSYAVIGAIVNGLMGIDVDPALVISLPRLTKETEWAEIRNLPVRGNRISARHDGLRKITITNAAGPALKWRACLPGLASTLMVDGQSKPAQTANGASCTNLTIPAGATATVETPKPAGEQTRWQIDADGGITWDVQKGQAHEDHIEMSGKHVSAIVTYGVRENGSLILRRHVVFPSLRTIPNDTHASLSHTFGDDASPAIFIGGKPAGNEVVTRFHHRGILSIAGTMGRSRDIAWTRSIFPSTDNALVIERYSFTNGGTKETTVEVEDTRTIVRTSPSRSLTGPYVISSEVLQPGVKRLKPGETASFALVFTAREEQSPALNVNVEAEERARRTRVESFLSSLILETPDPVLNTAFSFAKIRTTESIYETKGGLMHGPGGGAYYAAVWANDQAEYANPFFPFLGDRIANESAINSFRLFARYMNPDYKPIPSSIIAEGTSYWNGAGDRGDMAMLAYGAGRFTLAYGDRKTAEEFWPFIEWCLEYCRRKVNAQGVVASDTDELENRFPAGKANLSTSSLYYDALNSAVLLAKELGKPEAVLENYRRQAKAVRAAIERYFGAKVQGFETYRYYEGNTVLRSWICIPLTVGIFDRKAGTINALFSPALWTSDGLATQSGDKTFWDRSTLYALRGVLAAGDTERAMNFLEHYSTRRLLGEHVPYPVEAWPEGNQRHLAAESALYCRIFTEGLFGIRPRGFQSFVMTPRLPKEWDGMKLRSIRAFGSDFDLSVTRAGDSLEIGVLQNGRQVRTHRIKDGEPLTIDLRELQ